MGSMKRWRELGQGEFLKWETEGQELEGQWRGQHDGKFGPLGTLDTSEGKVTFPLHTALLDRLESVVKGADVRIVYNGKKTAKKSGNVFKDFTVFVADEDDIVAPARTDDEVPF